MKPNYSIGTLGRSKAKSLLITASALATFTFVQTVSADSSVLNQAGVYEQTIARPAWPHHVEVRFVTPRANGEHPAVIVARKFDKQDYDYQSKFYLHPAGLALSLTPPQPMSDDSAAVGSSATEFTQFAGESKAAQ